MTPASRVESVFATCFRGTHGTLMLGGNDEPVYQPGSPSLILYRSDYVASALHEVAHWCIAGAERRRQVDYGYWYESRRGASLQARFESAECRPQALEWVLSLAAAQPFRVSIDNDDTLIASSHTRFRRSVQVAARELLALGLPLRAARFARALERAFGGALPTDRLLARELPAC